MSGAKHSPTPYRLVGDKGGICRVGDQCHDVIIRSVRNVTSDDEWRATAAFIVTACNAHDALLAALVEIEKGDGPHSLDRLTHANNCVENMKNLARGAIIRAVPADTGKDEL